jgi:hypothetical protein
VRQSEFGKDNHADNVTVESGADIVWIDVGYKKGTVSVGDVADVCGRQV